MAQDGSIVPADPKALVAVKKETQSSDSWILFDSTGQGSILDVAKYEIMRRVQIHARDLRILDPILSYPSTILSPEKAIVLNLEHVKAIITADKVLLRDPTNENVVPVVEEFQRRLPNASANNLQRRDRKEDSIGPFDVEATEDDESPFEFRALEVALEAICSFLAARTTEQEMDACPTIDELASKMSACNLDRVCRLKSALTRLTTRVLKVYFMQIDKTLNKLSTLQEYIDDTEHRVNIQVVIVTGLFCVSMFVYIIAYARKRG